MAGGIAFRYVEMPAGHDPGEAGWHTTATIDLDLILSGRLELGLPGADPVVVGPRRVGRAAGHGPPLASGRRRARPLRRARCSRSGTERTDMLGPLDDTLWHQLPTTFDHVGTSDPRFFDRYWFAVTEPGGLGTLQFTLGVYNNMDVVDGGFVVVHDGDAAQRPRVARAAARASSPRADRCGSRCSSRCSASASSPRPGPHRVHGELEWTGVLAPRRSGRTSAASAAGSSEEYQRFNQIGECSGRLDFGGTAARPSTGGGGAATTRGASGRAWGSPSPSPRRRRRPARPASCSRSSSSRPTRSPVTCRSPSAATQRAYLTGLLRDRRAPDAPDLHVVDADLRVEMVDGTRRFHTAVIDARLDDGRRTSRCGPTRSGRRSR